MSHGGSGRDSCWLRDCRTRLHSENATEARGVTAPDVGSGDWLGRMPRPPASLFIVGRSSANPELNRNPKVRPTARCPALDPATTLESPDSAPWPRRPQVTAGLAPLAKKVPTANPDSALIVNCRLLERSGYAQRYRSATTGAGAPRAA
jgi:hypothetical protein